MKHAALLCVFAASVLAAPISNAQSFRKPIPDRIPNPIDEGKKRLRQIGVDPDRPLKSTGVPPVVVHLAKQVGVDPPTAQHPLVLPPYQDKLEAAIKDVDALGDKTLPEPLRKATERVQKLKSDILALGKQLPPWFDLLLQSLIYERKYPDSYGPQKPDPLPNPSVDISVSDLMISSVVAEWLNEQIKFDKGFLEITEGSLALNENNVIVLHVNKARISYKAGIQHTPHLQGGTLELLPVIWKKPGPNKSESIMLAFKGRCTGLDVESCPGEIDRFLANAITKFLDVEHGVGARDITKTLAKPISMGVASKQQLIPKATDLRAYVAAERLVMQANLEFTKEPIKEKPVVPKPGAQKPPAKKPAAQKAATPRPADQAR
jgi:hypothetical protein